MSKVREIFVCRSCGAEATRWQGQCSQCQEWNTMEAALKERRASPVRSAAATGKTTLLDIIAGRTDPVSGEVVMTLP